MKVPGFALFLIIALAVARIGAGGTLESAPTSTNPLDPPRFEVAAETAYLLCILNNPHGYEIGAEFVTARIRWGVVDTDSWFRGYQQFYILGMAEPIFRGPENYYYGMSFGLRYNFVRPGRRFIPYISGGVGLGWIDSHANIRGAQGQDFTFNILSAVGISYRLNDRWKANAGVLYQHLSNAGQTTPNPSLNLLGPQIGVTYSF